MKQHGVNLGIGAPADTHRIELAARRQINDENHQGRSRDGNSIGRPSVASLSRDFDQHAARSVGLPNQPSGIASQLEAEQRHPISAAESIRSRRPLGDLNAQVRSRNANQPPRQGQLVAVGNEDASLNSRRENMLPKHVTISPQAFLKFFSL